MTTPRELADRWEEAAGVIARRITTLSPEEAKVMIDLRDVFIEGAQVIRTLADQQDQNAKDAERYRWLRENEHGVSFSVEHEGNIGATTYIRTTVLDAAIDAARAQEPKT